MESINRILVLSMVGAAMAILVLCLSAWLRSRSRRSDKRADGGIWPGIFGDSGSSDSSGHHHSHHGHHHHDAGGSHHGGFDGGGHHGGFDGGVGGHH